MTLFNGYLEKFNKQDAIICDNGQHISYDEVHEFSKQIETVIGKRTLLFCLCENSMGSLLGYLAFISNKIVPLLLDGSIESKLLDNLISIYKPEFLWLPNASVENFDQHQIVFTQYKYSLIRIHPDCHFKLNDELALLLTTSGSTGSPKLVRLSFENIESNASSIAEYLSISSVERPITVLPMNYSFGLSIINSHFLKGATILLTDRSLMEKEFWTFLKNQKATTLSGVPYTYEILKRLRFFRMDLPSLKTLTQAGGKLHVELNREFAEYCLSNDKRFFVMYGQTEATARMSYLPHEHGLAKLGSIGFAIPGGEFELIDEIGNLVHEHDTVGELVYRGKNVSLGYAECGEDLCKGDENFGLLKTGDLAKRDSDNFYFIVGRKKRFIKIFGNRVNLDETERLLKNYILDCACTGSDDKMVIYITELNREMDVKQYISSKTGINQSAFRVRHIDAIPKNSSGKTIYANLEI